MGQMGAAGPHPGPRHRRSQARRPGISGRDHCDGGAVRRRLLLLPSWEKEAAKRPDEGCSRERQRLTPLEHPSSVSALRADPPSPARGEGGADATPAKA
ncbi:MAG: hypothetical protein EKK31_23315 [Hyphomicrobiales bacterium]|nr:MAG: hypothetical protein EKK31_23315 [Hyphomicrobiales bacterium]